MLINKHLSDTLGAGGYRWAAEENAISPYDFDITEKGERWEVKTTTGSFDRPFHISGGEISEAARTEPYRICRVYEISENSGRVRVSEPVNKFARELLATLNTLPVGVQVDGLSVQPEVLSFNPEFEIDMPDSESE